ncbi:MAG: hypothetical protein AAF202_01690, partial [Pseudomonadota bacterium]
KENILDLHEAYGSRAIVDIVTDKQRAETLDLLLSNFDPEPVLEIAVNSLDYVRRVHNKGSADRSAFVQGTVSAPALLKLASNTTVVSLPTVVIGGAAEILTGAPGLTLLTMITAGINASGVAILAGFDYAKSAMAESTGKPVKTTILGLGRTANRIWTGLGNATRRVADSMIIGSGYRAWRLLSSSAEMRFEHTIGSYRNGPLEAHIQFLATHARSGNRAFADQKSKEFLDGLALLALESGWPIQQAPLLEADYEAAAAQPLAPEESFDVIMKILELSEMSSQIVALQFLQMDYEADHLFFEALQATESLRAADVTSVEGMKSVKEVVGKLKSLIQDQIQTYGLLAQGQVELAASSAFASRTLSKNPELAAKVRRRNRKITAANLSFLQVNHLNRAKLLIEKADILFAYVSTVDEILAASETAKLLELYEKLQAQRLMSSELRSQ